jgi:ADP-ribosylglycohydrolase
VGFHLFKDMTRINYGLHNTSNGAWSYIETTGKIVGYNFLCAKRHFEHAFSSEPEIYDKGRWTVIQSSAIKGKKWHVILGILESLILIGLVVALVERILKKGELPISSSSNESNDAVSESASTSNKDLSQKSSLSSIHFNKDEVKTSFEEVVEIAGIAGSKTDKMVGVVISQAVGDAIGLTTEFMSKDAAQAVLKLGPLEYTSRQGENFWKIEEVHQTARKAWRLNFPFFGWTDDTDQAFSIVRAFQDEKADSSKTAFQYFAQRIIRWLKNGFEGRDFSRQEGGRENPSFSKPTALGLGSLVKSVTEEKTFIENPIETATQIWKNNLNFKPAANGALMRTSPIAVLFSNDFDKMIAHTIEMCEVTHIDPRCVASCVAANAAIFWIINGEKDIKKIQADSFNISKKYLNEKMQDLQTKTGFDFSSSKEFNEPEKELEDHINPKSWIALDLSNRGKMGYTYKCLGSAFFSLERAQQLLNEGKTGQEIFRTVITELVGEGGDADTNGAIAGAMLGAFLGFSSIPESWKKLRDQSVLLDMVKTCVSSE